MRLGFDLDDVVFDTAAAISEFVGVNYGIDWICGCSYYFEIHNNVFCSDKELNAKIAKDLCAAFSDGEFAGTVKPMEGAREAIQRFKHSGHSIHFISSRSKQLQPITFKLLRAHDIPFDSIDVIGRSAHKGFYGRKLRLDMFIDDMEKNLESMFQYKKRWRKGLLLFDRPWNSEKHDGSKFIRVMNWKDVLRHVGIQNR